MCYIARQFNELAKNRCVMPSDRQLAGSFENLDAVIFDTDGVITQTAGTHAKAWKRMFDAFLRDRSRREGVPFLPFDPDTDYRLYLDGKQRYDGVQSFLGSRGISLPFGGMDDPPDRNTVCGLGNRKNDYFLDELSNHGVKAYETSLEFIRVLRARGVRTAIISASRNCAQVLEAAGVGNIFDAKVDGIDAEKLGLAGKPDPAIFIEAARRLGVQPSHAAVIEDAIAGVEAGRRGGFGLVVGVDRTGHGDQLGEKGADLVVQDLAEISLDRNT